MIHRALVSVTLKSIAGALVVALGIVGVHGSVSQAGHDLNVAQQNGQSRDCRKSNDDVGHGSHDYTGSPAASLQQVISVGVPRTVFVRVDKSGRITAAATNTGCPPRNGDDFFLFRPGGTIEPTTSINADACNWSGDFAVVARFYAQQCITDHHPRHPEGPH